MLTSMQLHNSPSLMPRPGSLSWKWDAKRKFSVKSWYQKLKPLQHGLLASECIWKKTLKVECFTVGEAYLAHNNLQKRGINICSRCPLCENHNEDASHLFLHCSSTLQIWSFIFNILGVHRQCQGQQWT